MARKKKTDATPEERFGNEWPRQLENFITEVEGIELKMKTLKDERSKTYKRAKEAGFNTVAMKTIVRERQENQDIVAQRIATLEEYREALGAFADTPLGAAAMEEAGESLY